MVHPREGSHPPGRRSRTGAFTAETARREAVAAFLRRYGRVVAAAGLDVDGEAFVVTTTGRFAKGGVALTLEASAHRDFGRLFLDEPRFEEPGAAEAFLRRLRDELAVAARERLRGACDEIERLVDTVLSPGVLTWLGGEERARARFLTFPETLPAHEAEALARRRRRDVQSAVHETQLRHIAARLPAVPGLTLAGRTLHSLETAPLPFRGGAIEATVKAEAHLSPATVERLLTMSDAALPEAVHALLAPSRAAAVGRAGARLRRLEQQLVRLPHVELLSDDEIRAVVAPYFTDGSGPAADRARVEARSALVAVEEHAREAKYQGDVAKLQAHQTEYADVARYYPLARSLRRELVLYAGPTNSGKTWHALNELARATSGVYLAPLRLLALEGQEELEKRGRSCSFLTGEERDLRREAPFVSSTIEMLDVDREVDAVVIDEVQLLADERRGWAWLAAVLGAPARRVVMTGAPECVPLVREIAAYLGEPLTVHELSRFTDLRVAPAPGRLADVRSGTAVVCFSRRDVLRLKRQIEATTPHRVAVVYGNLSPKVRREEARRFRSGEADVLVATDAIAMGLNLPINEVLFYTTQKFDGEAVRELTPAEVRQIAGRAGRYGFASHGIAGALSEKGLALLRASLGAGPLPPLKRCFYVAPGDNHVRIIGKVLGTTSLERILTFFERAMHFSDTRFTRANIDELSYLASFVDVRLPDLPLADRLTVASAPVDLKSEAVLGWFLDSMVPALAAHAAGRPAEPDPLDELFDEAQHFAHEAATSSDELHRAENYLKALTVYSWLSYRFPGAFVRSAECEARRELVDAFIERSLRRAARLTRAPAPSTCSRPAPGTSPG